ncbi:MAG: hypothetical protein OEY20_18075, partial [Gemmatimonadota bacterium]|nr:hypothetical protein [Gemmatimonadota bacterium]
NAGLTVSGPGTLIVANATRPLVLGNDTIAAPLSIQNVLNVRAPTVATGTVAVTASGVLTLKSNVLAELTAMNGLTNAGTIVLHDDQPNASAALTVTGGALVNTGTIQTAASWGGGTRTITADLDLRGTLTIGFPLTLVGQLISPAGSPGTVTGNGSSLPVVGLDVDGITFDNTPLVSTGGTITRFDNVTFQNMSTGAIQLTINHPGAATPFTFTGVSFLTTPTAGGKYIRANDQTTGDPGLVIEMTGSTPADGTAYEEELNGAVINWIQQSPGDPILFAGDSASVSVGVFRVEGNGSSLTQILGTSGTYFMYPRWSPDRSRVVFSQNPLDLFHELWAVSSDGASSVSMVSDTSTFGARYSPNGVHVAFTCGDLSGYARQDVCVIADASGPVSSLSGIGNGTGKVFATDAADASLSGFGVFAWNPQNSDQLAVVLDSAAGSRIWLVGYDGSSPTPLTSQVLRVGGTDALLVRRMDWSPDGSFIVVEAMNLATGEQAIYRVEVSGGTVTQLTFPGVGAGIMDIGPIVSPDNSEVLFGRGSGQSQLLRVPTGGGQETAVSPALGGLGGAEWDWSPDGSEIVHVTDQVVLGSSIIAKIKATTTSGSYAADLVLVGRQSPVNGEIHDFYPSWRP